MFVYIMNNHLLISLYVILLLFANVIIMYALYDSGYYELLYVYIVVLLCTCLFYFWNIITSFIAKIRLRNLIKMTEKNTNSVIKIIVNNSNKYIDKKIILSLDDYDTFINVLDNCNKNKKTLKLIIHSTGGIISSSDIIVNAILNHKYKIACYIPKYANSAATSLALACNEIYLNDNSHLSPTDPQIFDSSDETSNIYSSKILIECLDIKKERLREKVLLQALEAKVLHNDNIYMMTKILKTRSIAKKNRNKILNTFTSGNFSHHYPVYFQELKELGINVKTPLPETIENICQLSKDFLFI